MSDSSYENAPATKMLASHCACCGHALVDAKSVELGIGPDCRVKYGVDNPNITDDVRREANRLVYYIAARQTGLDVVAAAEQLRALGLDKLADRVLDRMSAIRIEVMKDPASGREWIHVKTPYTATAAMAFRSIQGRWWDKERKVNIVPGVQRPALWKLLKSHFPKAIGVGPKGAFVVE